MTPRTLGVALVLAVGCARPAATAKSPTVSSAPAPAAAAPAALYDACAADADCVAAPALAGLEAPPADPTQAECGDRCFVAVARAQLAAWQALRARIEPVVPCHKKFGKCGPPPDGAVCRAGHCRLP